MAGKRMKLDLNMPIFKYELVHTPTLYSWGNAIESHDKLRHQLQIRWAGLLRRIEPLKIDVDNSRFIQAVVDMHDEMLRGTPIKIEARAGTMFSCQTVSQEKLMSLTVMDVAQGVCPDGLLAMMILGTWRGIIQRLSGPIPGTNFNISVAGIAGTCMKLGVPIEV